MGTIKLGLKPRNLGNLLAPLIALAGSRPGSPPQLPDCHPLPCRPYAPSPPSEPMVRLGKDIPVSRSGHTFLQISLTTIWWLLRRKSITADTFCDFYISTWL